MMKPYYSKGLVTIYHGDCREIIPTLSGVDLVIGDPPYGIGFQSGHRIKKHAKIRGDKAIDIPMIETAIATAQNAAYIFTRWDQLAAMPKPRSVLAWVKNNWSMGDLLHEHGRQWEAICFYPNRGHRFIKRIPDVVFVSRSDNRLHPTEKPVAMM